MSEPALFPVERTHKPFNPDGHALYGWMYKNGKVLHDAWESAGRDGGFVGTCRLDGHPLRPMRPVDVPTENVDLIRTDYVAVCSHCGHEWCAPDGKTLPRSSRKTERKAGAR